MRRKAFASCMTANLRRPFIIRLMEDTRKTLKMYGTGMCPTFGAVPDPFESLVNIPNRIWQSETHT